MGRMVITMKLLVAFLLFSAVSAHPAGLECANDTATRMQLGMQVMGVPVTASSSGVQITVTNAAGQTVDKVDSGQQYRISVCCQPAGSYMALRSSGMHGKCDSQVYDNVQVGVQPAAKLEALWTAPVASPESPISFSALLSKGPASTVDLVSWDAPAPSPAASCGCCSHSCSSILKVGGLDVRFEWQIDMAGTDDCIVADCTVQMNATAPADAWVGVGVGDAMDGSVVMVASKGATSWTAEPYTLSGHDAPSAKYTGGSFSEQAISQQAGSSGAVSTTLSFTRTLVDSS